MSLFKSRSGGSLFRIENLKGFLKYIHKNNDLKDKETVTNKMSLLYSIKNEKKGDGL